MLLIGHDEKDVGPVFSSWTFSCGCFALQHQSDRTGCGSGDKFPSFHFFLQRPGTEFRISDLRAEIKFEIE
jgi:hypothetical protein